MSDHKKTRGPRPYIMPHPVVLTDEDIDSIVQEMKYRYDQASKRLALLDRVDYAAELATWVK